MGDATLIISPDGHGVLIDAGKTGRGSDPIVDYLDRAKADNKLKSLDYTIVTHYDLDHLGGMDEVYAGGWYPAIAVYDRGGNPIRKFSDWRARECLDTKAEAIKNSAVWGSAPAEFCPKPLSCAFFEYLHSAEEGGKRKTLKAGDKIELDHGIEIVTLVANAKDLG